MNNFDAYDREKLEEARELLKKVFEYHYGDGEMNQKLNRLATIISKITELLNL